MNAETDRQGAGSRERGAESSLPPRNRRKGWAVVSRLPSLVSHHFLPPLAASYRLHVSFNRSGEAAGHVREGKGGAEMPTG
jgi:hypothetical protein